MRNVPLGIYHVQKPKAESRNSGRRKGRDPLFRSRAGPDVGILKGCNLTTSDFCDDNSPDERHLLCIPIRHELMN
jgi:hypothetical protein